MRLHDLKPNPGAKHRRKRLGCGESSGHGKTSGKGHKGQKARSGGASRYFEGGQMPIYRRLPKRGFKNPGRLRFAVINLDTLEMAIETGKIEAGGTVDADLLVKVGVVRRALDGLRLLGRGELSKPVTIEVAGASASAVAAVEKVGGKVVISGGAAVVEG